MQLLMTLGPAHSGTPDLLSGCISALQALTKPTPLQQLHLNTEVSPVINKGRIVVVTKLRSDQEAKAYYQKFCDLVGNINRNIDEGYLAIAHVHLVLLSFIGEGEASRVTNGNLKGGGSGVSGDVVEMQCGNTIASKLCSLVVRHYNLASTTVTGIPMKEEQNASSSANYDVELFHPAEAHAATLGDNSIRTTRQDTDYPTVTLKWCTPRTNASHELHQCSSAFRITSVDVNSRPSSCLTNFLLNGRWVMLEMPKKTPTQHTKVLSHMLAAHAGDIYIHTLLTTRSVLEDPPSISEGQGGKVTDYRIPDFAQLIHNNVLAQFGPNGLEKSREILERQTKIWPITLSQTALFSLPQAEPLIRNVMKNKLTDDQVVECKAVILNLTKMEDQRENLNTSHVRTKGLKKEDQYKTMWSELEQFLLEHNTTIQHQNVLECFLTCLNREASLPIAVDTPTVTLDDSPEETDDLKKDKSLNKRTFGTCEEKGELKRRRSSASSQRSEGQSLLSLWQQKNKSSEGRPQFAGRLRAENNVTKLYVNLQLKEKEKEEQSSRRK